MIDKKRGKLMRGMKHDSSTVVWNNLGEEWFELAQKGESRICFIIPYMLHYMGNVEGLRILDLGCGEGGFSREFIRRGGIVTAVDCSKKQLNILRS